MLGLAVAAPLAAGHAPAAPSAALMAEPSRVVLPNGLTVIVEERRAADVVALQLAARAGSRDDGGELGINAITSRMMFQGTGRRPSETELQRVATRVGGSVGRGTGSEISSITSTMPASAVDTGFDLLADVARDPLFDAGALGRLQRTTLQDLAQRQTDPATLLGDLFQSEMFAGHPASTPIIGTTESIQAVTQAALVQQWVRAWGAANLVLTVVGRISVSDAVATAARFFGPLGTGNAVERPPAQPLASDAARVVRGEVGQQQAQFRLGMLAPPVLHPDRYPFVVLNALMSGPAGRLFREVRTARGLAYSAGSGYASLTDTGAWYASAGVDPQNLPAALDVVRLEIERLRAAPPDAGEVAEKISQIAGQQILADEGNAARAGRLASEALLGTESTDEFVRRIREVTPEQLHAAARTYLDLNRALLVLVGPPGLTERP